MMPREAERGPGQGRQGALYRDTARPEPDGPRRGVRRPRPPSRPVRETRLPPADASGDVRCPGREEIGGSDPAGGFARYLSPDIWYAAGKYCPVRVHVILEDHDPDDEYETTEADYESVAPTTSGE